jgi:hypothetical protein
MMGGKVCMMNDPDTIRGWVARAEAEFSELSVQAERVQQQLAEARRQLMLFYEMLATATNAPVEITAQERQSALSVRDQVQDNAESILREVGHPMRAQDIQMEFVRRHMPLPGRGTPTNIMAHLVAAGNRFSRPSRGMYGLTEWDRSSHSAGPPPVEPSAATEDSATLRSRSPGRRRTRSS